MRTNHCLFIGSTILTASIMAVAVPAGASAPAASATMLSVSADYHASEAQPRVTRGSRLTQLQQRRTQRPTRATTRPGYAEKGAERRTQAFEKAATVEAGEVQARLDSGQEAVLNALAQADTAAITEAANAIGEAAGEAINQAPGNYLNQDQVDSLVAAAARAATISEQEVQALLKTGALAIESYEGLDAEAIATNLNTIGNEALNLQAEVLAKRPR